VSTVYISHNIDTEGPLAEAPQSSYVARKYPHLDVDFATCDYDELIPRHRALVLGSWQEIVAMLDAATSTDFRSQMRDSFGGAWIYNWFCMDHIGFIDNPRHRAMGIHQVFDFYAELTSRQRAGDALHWHFHPMSTYREAHRCATSYENSQELHYILGRRLLDRGWFPRANRPGFQDERQDAHWFLEQWIPFDFANTKSFNLNEARNPDLVDGRFSDWRFAPPEWRTYHPHHDCVQREGQCRRKIARSATLLNRFGALTEADLDSAFARAATGLPTLVALESHDWRDLTLEVNYVRFLIERVRARYPGVTFRFSEAVDAFNAVHPANVVAPVKLSCTLKVDERRRPLRLDVEVISGKPFGPQPYLAIRTRSKRIIHDHMNYWRSLDDYNYMFDDQSVMPADVDAIGVATNDAAGNQSIHVVDIDSVSLNEGRTVAF
jgi:hypothetical protein